MRVGLATDHGGYILKKAILKALHQAGHEVQDFGALELDLGDDFPDYVIPLARAYFSAASNSATAASGSFAHSKNPQMPIFSSWNRL